MKDAGTTHALDGPAGACYRAIWSCVLTRRTPTRVGVLTPGRRQLRHMSYSVSPGVISCLALDESGDVVVGVGVMSGL